MSQSKTKAIFFDFMGTCLDWHSSVVKSMPASISTDDASKLALNWRRLYFLENEGRFRQNLAPEDIDVTLARVLETALSEAPTWPEVPKAIQSLREDLGLEVFVHANGTTRLQLDLTRSSGLKFDMLFSSKLLGLYKPNLDAYRKALELVQRSPQEVVMVAAHAYDLRAAKVLGMKTIYIYRWTDDIHEDMEQVRGEFDFFLYSMDDLPNVIKSL
ncbi:haloacid dehalogenase [Penicillium malachiteum]|uniref:haloacid dehalogenase n=1 Tax=Penicillium malachiteum TaxID=1324776 RepID=UPI00254993E9|nr:haloacid dehalogenase [Penicillium malachiteum]KAJ5730673.1 haloacid dehalogenase [Penicillium malachiteum]